MKDCPECGASVAAKEGNCPLCGTRLDRCSAYIWTPSHKRRFCIHPSGHGGDHFYPATARDIAPSERQQERREQDRLLAADCPICSEPLAGDVTPYRGEFVHWACASDEEFHKVDADHGEPEVAER